MTTRSPFHSGDDREEASESSSPRRSFSLGIRVATAVVAAVAILWLAAWLARRGGDDTSHERDRAEQLSAERRRESWGPAFGAQATVADLKQAAVDAGKEVAAAYPDAPGAWQVLAHLEFHMGNAPEATKLWQKCLAADPKSGDALYGLGYLAYVEGDNAKAVERFRGALAASPADPRIPPLLAETLARLGKPEEAVPLLAEHLHSRHASPEALVALGKVCMDLKQYDKARDAFQKAVDVAPNNREALFGLGTAWGRLGDAGKRQQAMLAFQGIAADQSQKSIARMVGFDDMAMARHVAVLLYNEAAKVYDVHGNQEKAEEAWCKAAALDPKDERSRNELVTLYARLRRDRLALRACKELRDIDPANAEYWLNVGVLHGRLSQREDALAAVEQAMKLDPANDTYRQAYEMIRRSR